MSEFPMQPPSSNKRAGLSATVACGRIFVSGGHDGESPVRTLEVFEPGPQIDSPGLWKQMPPMLARRTYHQTVCLNDRVFCIGGSADGRTLNTIEVFDPTQNSWEHWFAMPPMHIKRTLHGAAIGEGKIVVCGGFDGTRDMATVEFYDPRANAWQTRNVWNLPIGRSYLALCTCAGRIYAIGGQDRRQDTGPRAHEQVEAFDLYSEKWLPVAPLPTGRLGLTASHIVRDGKNYLYVCGGSDGSDVLSSVEIYDVEENTWTAAPPMGVPRLGHAAAVLGGKLYVIGGYDGKDTLDSFECYDPEMGCWGPVLKISIEAPDVIQAETAGLSISAS